MNMQARQQATPSSLAPMQPLSDAQIEQVAGGQMASPELLTAPPPTNDQIVSPEL
jgi:hypothetical protein